MLTHAPETLPPSFLEAGPCNPLHILDAKCATRLRSRRISVRARSFLESEFDIIDKAVSGVVVEGKLREEQIDA